MKKLILTMTGEQVKLSSLQQDKVIASNRKADCQKQLYCFLVTSLTKRACNILLIYPIISIKDTIAFILIHPTDPMLLAVD